MARIFFYHNLIKWICISEMTELESVVTEGDFPSTVHLQRSLYNTYNDYDYHIFLSGGSGWIIGVGYFR